MINSAHEKITTKQTLKGRKTSVRPIKLFILLIGASLVSLSVISTGDAAPIVFDKSGLDTICREPDVYTGCINGKARCIPAGNGPTLVCDCKTGNCTTETTPTTSNPNRTAIDGLVTLKELQNLDSKISNLTSQVSSLVTGQSTLISLVGDVQALCSLSDLVPLARPLATGGTQTIIREPGDVCQRDSEGRLIFRVHNQGGIDAPASTTRVFFGCPNATCTGPTQVDVATPALPGFSGVELVVPIPNSCFSTTTLKCDFKIGVDAGEAVTEANEANNTTAGVCGPSIL